MSRSRAWVARLCLWSLAVFAASSIANAQFKVVGPPPLSAGDARHKIRTLLENVNPSNSQQTVDTISGLLTWYRDILDEELIAAWKRDERANLPLVMGTLASSRVASAVVEFSWRDGRQAALNLAYAPMLGDLMARYPGSAKPFLDDLLGQPPDLARPQAEAVCRILVDMPDIGTWKADAAKILPHYRAAAEAILNRDLHGDDPERSYRAQLWLTSLNPEVPRVANGPPGVANTQQTTAPGQPSPRVRPALSRRSVPDPNPAPVGNPAASAPSAPLPYNGAMSGTLTCGGPVPQNAEYVFLHVPLVKMQFDYDTKIWDVRLAPGDGQTQRLIVRNKSSSPQKRCVVHWSAIP